MSSESGVRNVVLVHGGFVDGSGWQAVHDLLTKDGHTVTVVQNPTRQPRSRRGHDKTSHRRPRRPRRSSSATHTGEPSSPKPAITPT